MAATVLCSTGLPAAERKALQSAIATLTSDVTYDGDLTDKTTHLIVSKLGQESEKLKVAKSLGLPIVFPSWVHESATAGHTLLPLTPKYLALPKGEAVDETAIAANSHLELLSVREPLPLLREAAKRGELCLDPTDPAAAGWKTILLCGDEYALDAPTGLLRQQGVTFAATGKHPSTASRGSEDGSSPTMLSTGRAYTLRELLFALHCSSKPHSDYFLACVAHQIEPVLLLDKRMLIAAVMPSSPGRESRASLPQGAVAGTATSAVTPASILAGAATSERATGCSAASSGRLSSAPTMRMQAREQMAPLSATATYAIKKLASDGQLTPASSAPSSAGGPNGGRMGAEERASLLLQLREAAEERAKLNAQVQHLTATLREERAAAEATCQYY